MIIKNFFQMWTESFMVNLYKKLPEAFELVNHVYQKQKQIHLCVQMTRKLKRKKGMKKAARDWAELKGYYNHQMGQNEQKIT